MTLPPPASRNRRPLWIVVLCITLLSLVPRLCLVHQTVLQNEGNIDRIGGDSAQYVDQAKNLIEFGRFAVDTPQARQFGTAYFSLLRPPVYPLFIASFDLFGWRPGVLWTQAVLGGVESGLIALLAGLMLRSAIGAGVAGLMAALSPTSIGLVGLVLADFLYAATFLAGFGLLWLGATRGRVWLVYLAGATFGAACLVKPAALYWPILLPLTAWLMALAGATRFRRRHALGAMLLAYLVMVPWIIRNGTQYGLYKVSTVDAQNLRYYLAPLVEEWARADDTPAKSRLKRNREAVMRRDEADLRAGVDVRTIVRRQWDESMAILRANPGTTWDAYWWNVENHFETPFNHFDHEMPRGGWMSDTLKKAETLTCTNQAFWVGCSFMMIGVVLPWAVPRGRRDASWHGRAFGGLALVVAFGYLCVFSGTTMYTGSRILYPAFFTIFILIAGGVVALVRDGQNLIRVPSAADEKKRATDGADNL